MNVNNGSTKQEDSSVENINWNAKRDAARAMTYAELEFAHKDCVEAARAMGTADMVGKDAGYYMDEASIYYAEMKARMDNIDRRASQGCDTTWR